MGTEHHTEVPATPDDYAHLCALETAARDGGVCIPETEIERAAEYARLNRIPYCEQCGHRVPADYPCDHLGVS